MSNVSIQNQYNQIKATKPGDADLKLAISATQINAIALNQGKPIHMKENQEVLKKTFPGILE
ncbi:hypothetical protein [Maribellus comscasis]|uniref:hypothetical protein n=1 Tax=Maribellus comscasis TaxID=2681766 RepID=UPI00131B0C1A|nr:hypothetical protein [Maribellus comscasis]